jgi:peroxiredoxin
MVLSGLGRRKEAAVPEVGSVAPEFLLPSAQGGQFRLSMRTVRGPVVVAFYDVESEEDEAYFKALAAREDEINLAGGSVVAIGVAEPDEARDFARRTGMKSYILYDYARVATRAYGVLEKGGKRPERARPATFLVGGDGKVLEAWVDGRPDPAALLARVSARTGLPKVPEEAEEPKRAKDGGEPAAGGAGDGEKPKKMTAEERERIKAERRAARAEGRSLKTGQPAGGEAAERPRLSPEEREKRRAERRAAREAGGAEDGSTAPAAPDAAEKPKKMTAEERERVKAERRAARAEGRSLKTPQPAPPPSVEERGPEGDEKPAGGGE